MIDSCSAKQIMTIKSLTIVIEEVDEDRDECKAEVGDE